MTNIAASRPSNNALLRCVLSLSLYFERTQKAKVAFALYRSPLAPSISRQKHVTLKIDLFFSFARQLKLTPDMRAIAHLISLNFRLPDCYYDLARREKSTEKPNIITKLYDIQVYTSCVRSCSLLFIPTIKR